MSANVACVLLMVLTHEAAAQSMAVVGVGHCDAQPLALEVQQLQAALSRWPGTRIQSLEEGLPKLGGLPRRSLEELSTVPGRVRGELKDTVSCERAAKTLEEAIRDLEGLPPSVPRWSTEREARTLLSFVHAKLGQRAQADEALTRVLRVEPGYQPDPRWYPPSFREVVERNRRALENLPWAPLTVTTVPSSFMVFIDGRPLAEAPVTVKLPLDTYRVEAAFAESHGVVRSVVLKPGGTVVSLESAVEGALVKSKAGLCLNSDGPWEQRRVAMAGVGALLQVSQLIGIRVQAPGRAWVVSQLDVGTGAVLREAWVQRAGPAYPPEMFTRLAEFLMTGKAKAPVQIPPPTSAVSPVQRSASPGMRTAAWVMAGGAVMATTAAVLFQVQSAEASNRRRALLLPSGVYPPEERDVLMSLVKRERMMAHRAMASAGIALAMAAGAVGAYAVSRRTQPEPTIVWLPTWGGLAISARF